MRNKQTSCHTLVSAMLYVSCVLVMVLGTGNGAFLTPTAYTLPGVMAVNGSNATGGCPTPCVGVTGGITTCDCGARSGLGPEAITGVLIDGAIPTIDTAERNTNNEFVWAAPLFTMRGDTITLGFQFSARVVLQEVELYLLYCPNWGIGAENIRIFNGATFPLFFPGLFSSIGIVTLASDEQNCDSLTRVSIPLQMTMSTQFYFIQFTNPPGDQIEWVHTAEVRFSDQPITSSATPATTSPTTTGETTAQLMETTAEESASTTEEDVTGHLVTATTATATTSTGAAIPVTTEDDTTTTPATQDDRTIPQDTAASDLGAALDTTDGGTYCITPQTTPCTCSAAASSPTTIIIILVVVIAVLLCLLAVGGALFLVCVLRAKSSRREGRKGRGKADRVYESIKVKRNEAYGDVRGRGGEGPSGEERIEAYGLVETPAGTDGDYEEVQ